MVAARTARSVATTPGGGKSLRPGDYINKASALKQFWQIRNTKFLEWYKILRLDDVLRQTNMESFTGNDPRTLYNLALFLLTPEVLPINIPIEEAAAVDRSAISDVESTIKMWWRAKDREARSRGRQSWARHLNSLMLATGWYAVFAIAADDALIADIWNPAEVFPDFSDGLASVAHVYTLSASAARRKIAQKGWQVEVRSNQPVEVVDYWEYNESAQPENTIVVAGKFAKPPTAHSDLLEIPVHVGPVGGLPDNGIIDTSETWKQHIGESIVGTNEGVYHSYNKQLTFLQQILRDTAQPRFKERSRHPTGVLTPENIFKRGAIYKLDVDEDIGVVEMPSIPAELRTQLFDIQGMIQRGGFPWALYGNIQQQIAGYLMSQIAAAANQILRPYRDAEAFLITDICNSWLDQMRNGVRPLQYSIPTTFPDDAYFNVDIKIQVPGDLILRASTARQLDPDFRISTTTTMDLLFPEIADPDREIALTNRDAAMRHPAAVTVSLIAALRGEAEQLAANGETELAALYTKAAQQAEAQLVPPQAGPGGNGRLPPGPTGNANIVPQEFQ